MPFAARITDLHQCPMQTPGALPHVGGPIIGPGVANVLIGGMPAAIVGDSCACIGPSANISSGSATVFINNMPAARIGDLTSHGGSISLGCTTVIIGG